MYGVSDGKKSMYTTQAVNGPTGTVEIIRTVNLKKKFTFFRMNSSISLFKFAILKIQLILPERILIWYKTKKFLISNVWKENFNFAHIELFHMLKS